MLFYDIYYRKKHRIGWILAQNPKQAEQRAQVRHPKLWANLTTQIQKEKYVCSRNEK